MLFKVVRIRRPLPMTGGSARAHSAPHLIYLFSEHYSKVQIHGAIIRSNLQMRFEATESRASNKWARHYAMNAGCFWMADFDRQRCDAAAIHLSGRDPAGEICEMHHTNWQEGQVVVQVSQSTPRNVWMTILDGWKTVLQKFVDLSYFASRESFFFRKMFKHHKWPT